MIYEYQKPRISVYQEFVPALVKQLQCPVAEDFLHQEVFVAVLIVDLHGVVPAEVRMDRLGAEGRVTAGQDSHHHFHHHMILVPNTSLLTATVVAPETMISEKAIDQ